MLNTEAKVALISFFGPLSFLLISFILLFSFKVPTLWAILSVVLLMLTSFLILTKIFTEKYEHEIAIRAAFLGMVFFSGFYVATYTADNTKMFGFYMCIMSVFHYSEFLILALIDSNLVNTRSFMLNHSPEYTFAAVFSWVEFFVETYFWPFLKQYFWISFIGCLICICGEILRKTAMINAGRNFNHLVQFKKSKEHILVTSGTYRWFRHPSYVGWFYWSIGTQIVLLNPLSLIGYTIASWHFFNQRIFIEEMALLNFFGQKYCEYQAKVGTGLPFIKGYVI